MLSEEHDFNTVISYVWWSKLLRMLKHPRLAHSNQLHFQNCIAVIDFNSFRPDDAYMRQWTSHYWFSSDNGSSNGRRQASTWTNARVLVIGPLWTNFSKILIETDTFKKIHLKMSSGKCRPFFLGLNVLMWYSCNRSIDWPAAPRLIATYDQLETTN